MFFGYERTDFIGPLTVEGVFCTDKRVFRLFFRS